MKSIRSIPWRALRAVLAGLALPAVSARCAMPEPWVKPYERERLADPMMQFRPRRACRPSTCEHVREVREGVARRHRRAGGRLWLQLTAASACCSGPSARCARSASDARACAACRSWRRRACWARSAGSSRRARAGGGLPEDRADLMYHRYDGGGVTASGPALLVRKSLLNKVSLSASYYVDIVSNASIDVVTTASPYNETRNEFGIGRSTTRCATR